MKPLIVLALIVLCENTLVFAFPSRESSKETGNEIEQEFKYFKPSDLGYHDEVHRVFPYSRKEIENYVYLALDDLIRSQMEKEQKEVSSTSLSRQKRFIFLNRAPVGPRASNTTATTSNVNAVFSNYLQRRAERRRLRMERRRLRFENFRKQQQAFFQNLAKQQALTAQRFQTLNQNTQTRLNAINANRISGTGDTKSVSITPEKQSLPSISTN